MAKFSIVETIYSEKVKTVRLGASTPGQQFDHAEVGKAVKLAGESQYVLCAAGDPIEAIVSSSNLAEQGTQDGFALGGIVAAGYKNVVFDGVQGTPGTGTVAMGAYVVVGTVVARATALTGPLRVTSATNQATAATAPYKARVVSLGTVGTGAVGTVGVVEMF
jgi:hypothetical protein